MPTIAGYAAVFDSTSNDLGFLEQIDPGAFDQTLENRADVRCLYNHDPNLLLGRTSAGTLRLRVDQRGLYYECDINPSDRMAMDAYAKVQRGDCTGSSFSFQTVRDRWDWSASPPRRRLLQVDLLDVGPCTFPAYPAATAQARSLRPVAVREGKVLSSASVEKVKAAHDHAVAAAGHLRDLLEVAKTGAPLDSELEPGGEPEEASIPVARGLKPFAAANEDELERCRRQLVRRIRKVHPQPLTVAAARRRLGRRLERDVRGLEREAFLAARLALAGPRMRARA